MRLCLRSGAVALACAWPVAAWANAGTPLMWAGFLHLTFGNALIGIAEGLVLSFCFRRPKALCIGVMIAANYFSAFCGHLARAALGPEHWPITIYNIERCLVGAAVLAYALTLLLEYPFVWAAVGRRPRRAAKACWGSLLVQSLSYAALALWYGSVVDLSLIRETRRVAPRDLAPMEGVVFYYVAQADGDIYRLALDGANAEKVIGWEASRGAIRALDFERSAGCLNRWSLVACLAERPGSGATNRVVVAESLVADVALSEHAAAGQMGQFFGYADRLGSGRDSSWEIRNGFWKEDGLRGRKPNTDSSFRLAVGSPFVSWPVRRVTLLPGERLLFQIGRDQICLYEIQTRKLALLVNGHSPVPVLSGAEAVP